MTNPIVIVGAGGFGRHVLSILRATRDWNESEFLGFLDDGAVNAERLKGLNAIHLGPTAMLNELPKNTQYVIGIGKGSVREALDQIAVQAGLHPLTVIHPDSSISPDSIVGEGAVICAGARITTNVHIGRQVHLNMNVTVGHDVRLDSFATVFPLVALGGESVIGKRTTIGAGSAINPGIRTGSDSYIASGAVVINDVPEGVLVAGVPATAKKSASNLT